MIKEYLDKLIEDLKKLDIPPRKEFLFNLLAFFLSIGFLLLFLAITTFVIKKFYKLILIL